MSENLEECSKEVHLLKFKWLWSVCVQFEEHDYLFITSTLPTLRHNAYGLSKGQIEKLDAIYEKYQPMKKNLMEPVFD